MPTNNWTVTKAKTFFGNFSDKTVTVNTVGNTTVVGKFFDWFTNPVSNIPTLVIYTEGSNPGTSFIPYDKVTNIVIPNFNPTDFVTDNA